MSDYEPFTLDFWTTIRKWTRLQKSFLVSMRLGELGVGTKMIDVNILKLPNKEFSVFAELLVGFELKKLGWRIYQPLIDRYIDIVAVKGRKIRTIQVKSSRVESEKNDEESYGLTQEPKDLFRDPRHFFVWMFIDNSLHYYYFVFSVKDFIDVRWKKLPVISRRKYPSLLMRREWRHGTDRMHPHHLKENDEWILERVKLNDYLNKWEKLENEDLDTSFDKHIGDIAYQCISAQEINKEWGKTDSGVLKKWKEHNNKAEEKLKTWPETYESVKKLDEFGFEEPLSILDAHFSPIDEDTIKKLFRYTEDNWEIFIPLDDVRDFLLLKPVCSKCGKWWNTSRKECYYCKTKYVRVKVCPQCGKLYPENVPKCRICPGKPKTLKQCIMCGQKDTRDNPVFLPITFCWYCGNRKNKFDFKIMERKCL